MAVGRSGPREQDGAVARRGLRGPVRAEDPVLDHDQPGGGHRLAERGEAVLGGLHVGDVARHVADVADPLVAQRDEVLDRGAHRGPVVDAHAGPTGNGRADRDQREPEAVDELDLLGLHRHVERDDAVDPLPQHVLGQRQPLVVAVVLEVEEDGVVPLGAQLLLDGADQGREEPAGEERRDDGDDAGPTGRQRRRRRRRDVAQLLGHLEDALAGLGGDPVQAPERAGDRGDRHPGRPRDIGDRADGDHLSFGRPLSPSCRRRAARGRSTAGGSGTRRPGRRWRRTPPRT